MKTEEAHSVLKTLLSASEVAILMHTNPDGDAVGSALAMAHFLSGKSLNVKVFAPDAYPDFLAWMPGAENILIHEQDPDFCNTELSRADTILCVDFNFPDRVQGMEAAFSRSTAKKINIDHHIFRGKFCDLEYTDTEVSSTAELICKLLTEAGEMETIGKEAAECLYVGILTDTGSFSYSCNYESTFVFAARLLSKGIDVVRIHQLVYSTYSEQRLRLIGFCLSEKLRVMPEYGSAWITLSLEELQKFGYRNGDTEGVVNYTLGIRGMVFGALLTERNGKIRVSLRSTGSFDVNKLARTYFNGGGHRNAAGGDMYCSLEEAEKTLKRMIAEHAGELKKNAGL